MKKCLAIGFVLVMALSLFCVGSAEAKFYGPIYIRSDGGISPSNAPIKREGNVYRLLDDMYNSPVVLERNDMVFDGGGYTLEGAGTLIGLNITCSNVTVTNLIVWNWDAGVLGAYNNVTIQNCNVTGNGKGIAIYANNYQVAGNYIAQNEWGIRVQGNDNGFSGNHFVDNSIGIWITSYEGDNARNTITYNTIESNGQITIETDMDGGFVVHHNNFILSGGNSPIVQTAYLAIPGDESQVVMAPWDNGAEGNYWSNFAAKYPNASELGNKGVYDTPYVINVAPNLTDRYPLVQEVALSEVVLPVPSSTPSPVPSPTTTLSPTPTQSPSASPIPSSPTSPSPQQQNPEVPVELLVGLGLVAVVVIIAVAFVLQRRGGSKA